MAEHTTQPGWWHDPRQQYWHAHDRRGQRVVTVTDESARRIVPQILISRLRREGVLEPAYRPLPEWARHG